MSGLDSNTKLLLHCNGQDGGKEIIDSGNTGHVATQVATAQLKSSQYKFGDYSVNFNGTNQYLSVPDSTDWDFGSGDFTIDFWIKRSIIGTQHNILGQASSDALTGSITSFISNQNKPAFAVFIGDSANYIYATGTIDTNWHHIAIVRNGTTVKQYIDGTEDGSYTIGSSAIDNYSGDYVIGRAGNYAGFYFDGYLDEVRISKGVARWTSNFTPPTEEYSSDSNTKLLLHLNNNLTDSGNTGHTVTAVNNPAFRVQKFGSSACWFDGNSDYLTIPDSADWDIFANTSDSWTIDFWVKIPNDSNWHTFLNQEDDTNNRWNFYYYGGTNNFYFDIKVGGSFERPTIVDTTLTDNDWHHIVIMVLNNIQAVYIDGNQVGYNVFTNTSTFSSPLLIGYSAIVDSGNYLNGWMDEVRVQKSNAFSASPNSGKTDTITVPTSEHTSDSNTKLLLHMNSHDVSGDGGSNLYHIPTFIATAQVDTAVKKFGTGSLMFDGNSDYLTIPDSADWNFGSGDFTIDYWFKLDSGIGATFPGVYSQALKTTGSAGVNQVFTNTGNLGWFYINSSNYVDLTSYTFSLDVWHHYAVAREGNNFRFFIDGQLKTTWSNSSSSGDSIAPFKLGLATTSAGVVWSSSDNYFQGYLDEFRVSNTVRWTSNFTPPTQEYSLEASLFHLRSRAIIIS